MNNQLVFDLPVETAFGREDYFVSGANSLAVAQVEDPSIWTNGRLVLTGPSGSGKSHLLSIWAEDTNAEILDGQAVAGWEPKAFTRPIAIDNIDSAVDQTALFHLLNHLRAENQPVLMTALQGPTQLGLTLPDLVSRLEASTYVSLGSVDDVLLQAVLLKQFDDRQLVLDPNLLAFALERTERSLSMVKKLVLRLDQMSLQRKKAVTKRLMSEAIAALESETQDD